MLTIVNMCSKKKPEYERTQFNLFIIGMIAQSI